MLSVVLGLALTAALLTALARRSGSHATEMGAMSSNWVAANRAGERGGSSL